VGDAGVLVDGHAVRDWADAVDGLLRDSGRRMSLGRRAIDHARQFGWGTTTDRLLAVYRQAIRERRLSPGDSPIDDGQNLTGIPTAVIP
jgi:D-inositol-3-phosphate glycosyltransferase